MKSLQAALLAAVCLFSLSAQARTYRSQSAKVEFKLANPCPFTEARKGPCKGYVIDHINPLACGFSFVWKHAGQV